MQARRQADLRLTLRSLAWASVITLPTVCTRFAALVTHHSRFAPLPSKMPRYQRAKSSTTPIAITLKRIADSQPLVRSRSMGTRGSQDSARSRRSPTRAWKAPNSSSPNRLKVRWALSRLTRKIWLSPRLRKKRTDPAFEGWNYDMVAPTQPWSNYAYWVTSYYKMTS